jgi:hypothetical protein
MPLGILQTLPECSASARRTRALGFAWSGPTWEQSGGTACSVLARRRHLTKAMCEPGSSVPVSE